MLAIAVLLLLITYIFAVMFTEIFGTAYADGWTDENYFGRLDETFFTLFQMMTFDNWENICRQLMVVYPTAWLPVIAFIICTAFVIVNLIVAVICDAVSALHDDDKAKLHGRLQTDDGQTDAESESETSKHESMGSHLDALEEQVGELFRMQEETMSTLHLLTQFVADKQQRKVTSSRRRRQRDQNTSSNATEANDKD
jgi:ABC-type multidrug transport system fused ATPase/permease subunit